MTFDKILNYFRFFSIHVKVEMHVQIPISFVFLTTKIKHLIVFVKKVLEVNSVIVSIFFIYQIDL